MDAIIINPADRSALDDVIAEAASQGIPVISVDAPVTAPEAYFVSKNLDVTRTSGFEVV